MIRKYNIFLRATLVSIFFSCQPYSDSENVFLVNNLFGEKRLCIIGDSISTFSGFLVSDIKDYSGEVYKYYYPESDVNSVVDTWWYKVAMKLGIKEENIINCSWSGSRVTGNALSKDNAFAGCSIRRIKDVAAKGFVPDIILCYISCNDWANDIPIGTWSSSDPLIAKEQVESFREAYALMVSQLKTEYPTSKVFCLTILEDVRRDRTIGCPANNNNNVTIEEWNHNIIEIAESLGVGWIDLHDCGITYDNIDDYTVDHGLHPNSAGMTLMANKVVNELMKLQSW